MFWSGRQLSAQPFHGIAVTLLRRQIHLGMMRPDERLPPERKFAQDLGISRVTLREALSVLEESGYLTTKRGATGGTFVVSDERLNVIARRHLTSDPARAWRCLEFLRANLEMAASCASERRSPSDLAELDRHVDALRNAESGPDLREARCFFFLTIGSASSNTFLKEAIDSAIEGLFHPISHQQFARNHRKICDLCAALADAINRQDPPLASSLSAALTDGMAAMMQEGMAPPSAAKTSARAKKQTKSASAT
ncbi:MAG: GntR family transcriptional regulator [Pseudomonadota bacterium]